MVTYTDLKQSVQEYTQNSEAVFVAEIPQNVFGDGDSVEQVSDDAN